MCGSEFLKCSASIERGGGYELLGGASERQEWRGAGAAGSIDHSEGSKAPNGASSELQRSRRGGRAAEQLAAGEPPVTEAA